MINFPRVLTRSSLIFIIFAGGCVVRVEESRDRAPRETAPMAQPAPAAVARTPKGGDDADATASRVAAAERALELAKLRLAKAGADVGNQETAAKEQTAAAQTDVELSKRALDNFDQNISKTRLARGQIDLTNAKDFAAEREEELLQIQMMYEKTDLSDKTRELVIRRNERRVENARRGLELQEQSLRNLQTIELPLERSRLQADLDAKTRSLARAVRDAASGLADKKLAVQSQECDVAKLEEDLAAAKRAAAKAAEGAK